MLRLRIHVHVCVFKSSWYVVNQHLSAYNENSVYARHMLDLEAQTYRQIF